MTDISIMPWGTHRGKKMANVPADYLLWIYDNNKTNHGSELHAYITNNLPNLREEAKKQKAFKERGRIK